MRWLSGQRANLLTRRSVALTLSLSLGFSCVGLGNLAVSQPSCFIRMAGQLGLKMMCHRFQSILNESVNGPWFESDLRHSTSLSRFGQPGSIPVLVLPSGGMAARHRKGAAAERFLFLFFRRK
ncbi:hypothetical protein T265_02693 [Opisthorchis viverrini]|uniref:Uncharacterized protein n=1 Tax=Opisthorchis viverrini TaxID=6198 RepID=A0A075AI50_OPIVI|nr:hypothetical protein T265_02693 [Opisthorchis viverrini]KER31019.1 hypothetical protein T265_02693 [Opisthorchis viverrini]